MPPRRFEAGLVHTTVLSTYQPICGGSLPCSIYNPGLNVGPSGNSDQYNWLAMDLASVRCHATHNSSATCKSVLFTTQEPRRT